MQYRIVCPDNDEVVSTHRTSGSACDALADAMDRYKAVMVESDGGDWVLSEILVVESENCYVARTPQELEAKVPKVLLARVTDQRNVLKGSIKNGKYVPWKDSSLKPGTTWSSEAGDWV